MANEQVLNKKTTQENEAAQTKAKALFQGIAFYLSEELFLLDVMSILEIYLAKRIFPLPNTTKKLLGVINFRGNILPVYSLKRILEMDENIAAKPEDASDEENYIIMIKKDKDIFGLLIDAIYRNVSVTEDNYREGKYLKKWARNFLFKGVVLEGEREILDLDIDNLLRYMVSLK